MRPAWLVLVVGLAAVPACRSDPPSVRTPQPGSALTQTARDSHGVVELPPGQEVIQLVRPLRNVSDGPLEITKLRAIPGDGIPTLVQIVKVALVTSTQIDPGTYVTFPPVARSKGECVRAEVRPTRGATLSLGEGPLLLVWLRALSNGRARVAGFRVSYEQAGTLYEQE